MNHVLRRNLGLKLVSLILAYLAWTVVVGRPEVQKTFDVNVFLDAAPDTVVVDYSPRSIQADVSGDESIFRAGLPDLLSVNLDVSHLGPGQHEAFVRESDIRNLPRGAQVQIIEDVVTVQIEEKVTRSLPVTLNLAGTPPETHRLQSKEVRPERVVVSGPSSTIEALEEVRTEPVDLGDSRLPFARSVRIQSEGRAVTIEPEAVRVRVEIVERSSTGRVTVAVEGVPQGWRAEPARVELSVTAATSVLPRSLGAARARITAAPAGEARISVPVEVSFPGLPGDVLTRIEASTASPPSVELIRADAPR